MTMQTSRRAILAGAATLPALAIPAATPAVSATMPSVAPVDPAVVAVAEYNTADQEWSDADRALNEAEAEFWPKHAPLLLVSWRQWSAIGGKEIERVRDELLSAKIVDNKIILKEYRQVKAEYRKKETMLRKWYERRGLDGLHARVLRAEQATHEAEEKLPDAHPTTIAGVAALISLVHRNRELWSNAEWEEAVLKNALDFLNAA